MAKGCPETCRLRRALGGRQGALLAAAALAVLAGCAPGPRAPAGATSGPLAEALPADAPPAEALPAEAQAPGQPAHPSGGIRTGGGSGTPTHPEVAGPTPAIRTAGSPVPPSGPDPGPAPADPCAPDLPGTHAAGPETSPVTWTLTSLDLPDLRGPATAAVAFPHRFRFTFAGDVDPASVEAALRARVERCGFRMEAAWPEPRTLDIALTLDPREAASRLLDYGRLQVHLALAGARDAEGRPLAHTWQAPQMLLEAHAPTTLWLQDPARGRFEPTPLAALPQPFDVLSLSPDGKRLLLRLPALPSLAAGAPVAQQPRGQFFLYDLVRGQMTPLAGLQGPIGYLWLPDGAILAWQAPVPGDGDPEGEGPGEQEAWGRVVYGPPAGSPVELLRTPRVVAVAVDPTGHRAAVFTLGAPPRPEPAQEPPQADLTVIDLPGGRRSEFPAVAHPWVGSDGTLRLDAALAPGGEVLALADAGPSADAGIPAAGAPRSNPEGASPRFTVWLLETGTGKRTRLDRPGVGTLGPWSLDGRLLAIGGVGVVDRKGMVRLPFTPDQTYASWSPDGRHLFVQGRGVLATETWETVLPLPGATEAIWAPTGERLAVLGSLRSGIVDLTGRWLTDGAGPGILWSPDGRWAYVPSSAGGGAVLDLAGETRFDIPRWPLRPGLSPIGAGPRPLAFTPDGRLLLAPRIGP
ncbi:MAG: hypothetical protein DIU70_004255 [Bacillota bacterium]